ncbi:O-antigen ligase family protein [Falsiroseomonas sp. CW058]|uniref:O-antigen ligase family protein n=1 Tax=Falsiroseomonas sp. CW058 TaxID=3388664 RepID=UPI003D31CD59
MAAAASTPWHRAPSLPVTVLLATAPAIAVLQFRTMAPAVTVAFLLSVVAHWRIHRALPWPRPTPMLALAAALLGWALASAAWSIEPARAAETTGALAALLLLGAMAGRAVAADDPAHLRRMGPALVAGLAAGILLLGFDHATDNLLRRAVRGLPPPNPVIGFGLKPAVSLLALLLPLALAAHRVPMALRLAVAAAGLAVALWLPGDSAKIAAVLGLGAATAALAARRAVAMGAAAALAAAFLLAPLAFAALLARAPALEGIPRSAAHRVLIWDFVEDRIAERPAIGWGMEASRSIPGGDETFDAATLARFGLTSPEARHWFAAPSAKRLPLHTHNAALQVWLELGAVGAVLAAALAAAVLLAAGATPVPAAALGAAVAGAVTGQLSFGVWQPWWIASLLLAAVAMAGLGRAAKAR